MPATATLPTAATLAAAPVIAPVFSTARRDTPVRSRLPEELWAAATKLSRRDGIEATAQACEHFGVEAFALATDVTREVDVERLVATAIARFGRLDAVFNNAGFQERRAPLEAQDSAVYDTVFDTNVRGVFLCLRHQLPVMFAQGSGRIVINASVSGFRNPNPGLSLYSASKAAVLSLVRSAAMEAASRGVSINAVAPGWSQCYRSLR